MKKICFIILMPLLMAFSTYGEDMRIKMTFNNETVIVKLFDNPTSRDFYSRLPMTLTFKDYVNTEKIAYLPEKLSTQGMNSGGNGDFTYFAPWGNLAIFYKGGGGGLVIHMGKIESGKDRLAAQKDDFTAKIEQIK